MPKNIVPLKTLLAVSEAAATESLRPALTKLHFKGDLVEATNGFMLIQVRLPGSVEEDFISVEAVARAARVETKPKVAKSRRRIFRSEIVQPKAEVENGRISVLGGSVKEMEPLEQGAHYPEVSKVIPQVNSGMARVVLNPKYLIKACNAARRLGIDHLEFFVDPKNTLGPLLIKGKTFNMGESDFTAAIMPINA